jgi:SAM-dependent methyltransferase
VSTKEQPIETYVAKDYWERRLTEKWGLQGVGHISFGLPYNRWLYRMRKRVFRRHIAGLGVNVNEANVLDIGSGTGFWLEEWRHQGARRLTGVDITEVAVEKLRESFPDAEILRLDIADPKARQQFPGRFDVISMFDVLFHITKDTQFRTALANVAGLLNPGGYFIFSDHLVHTAPERFSQEVHRTLGDLTRALDRAGLEIERRVPMFVLMNTPFDSTSRFLSYVWLAFMAPVHIAPALGHLYGAVLYPLDSFLTAVLKESPSTEMIVCRKAK